MSIARSTHSAHRKVFGPRTRRSEATKALHVAENMVERELNGQTWTWQETYGIDPASPYGHLVHEALVAKRAQEGLV